MWWLLVMRLALCAGVPPLPDEHARRAKSAFDNFHEHYLTPDDFVLAEHTPVARPTPAELDAVQNSQLFEGDIAGVPEDAIDPINRRMRDDVMLDEDDIFSKPYHSSLNLATYPDKLWTEGQVPYMLEEGMTAEQRAAIAQAFDEYKQKTCIRFVPRNDDDFDYIYVKRNVAFGCSSYVGRAGGNQTVSLEVDKCFSKGIIAHELMHALGFFHEHSRTDRDQFVDIQEDNIRPGMMRNFEKYPKKIIDPLGMPYDYESVMHYHKLAFSRNGKATIQPHDKNAEVGQRYRLSPIDAKKVNKLYQCGEFAKTTTTTTTTTTEQPTTTTEEEEVEEEEVEESTVAATRRTTTRRPRTKPTKHTTRTTTPRPTSTSTQRPKSRKRCEDLNAHCEMWSQLGHCEHSLKYMSHYCPKSCGHCSIQEKEKETKEVSEENKKSGEKKDKGKDKKPKGTEGRGGKNIKEKTTWTTVSTTRKPSEKCADKNLFCGYWAKIGECKSDSKFMKIFCKQSCGEC